MLPLVDLMLRHIHTKGAHHHAFTPVNACTDGGHLKPMTVFCRLD